MANMENILISLETRHAKNIYSGVKKIELRRRIMHVTPGATVWIYEKMPIGSITGSATIMAVHTASPAQLWRRFGSVSGLTEIEFFAYFTGIKVACVLILENALLLQPPLLLASLKNVMVNFQPPQFFVRLGGAHPVLLALHTHCNNRKRSAKSQAQPPVLAAV
jgi:predicted transcriptional regulator